MKQNMHIFRILVLAVALIAAGQTAWADKWSVTYETYSGTNDRYASFIVTRSETGEAQTVKYRTISLTAPAGKFFEEKTGELTFNAGQAKNAVRITEKDLSDADLIYNYWTYDVSYRSYRFEVLDNTNGTELAHCDRPITHGSAYNIDATTLFQNKEITAFTGPVTVDDAQNGFGQASYVINPKDAGCYASADAPKAYLTMTGAKLAMSFEFQVKEKEDGYQYLQVLVDDETNYDSGNEDGDIGKLQYAQLLAGFGHDPGKKNTQYAQYAFPVPGITDFPLADYDNRWKNYGNTVGRLYSQKIKPGYLHEPSGRVLADPSLSKLVVRFDASGKNDDTWYAKDFKAHIQAIDETKPTIIADDVRFSPGPYAEGSTFYLSVPFSEIVVVPSNANLTIATNWGNLTYDMGSGTNVLVFKGQIGSGLNPTAQLQITGLSGGPVRDLWGNPFVGDNAINVTFPAQAVPANWTGTGTKDDPYLISDNTALDMLYQCVNVRGIDFGPDVTHPDGYFFKLSKDIKYQLSTSNTPNYNAIGTQDHPFRGHFDGNGKTVEYISIYSSNSYQGLFGYVVGGTLENIILNHPIIQYSSNNSDYAAGLVGCCVGGTIRNCFVYDAIVKSPGSHCGAIVGNDDAIQEHNYYRSCTVQNQTVQNVYSINVDEGVTVSSPVKTYYDTGYFLENAHVRLFAPIGKSFSSITVTRNSDQSDVTADVLSGTTIIMPAYDITVSSPLDDVWDVAHGADGSKDHPYIISTPAGWDALAAAVNRGEHYYEKFFKLSDDFDNSALPVTTMVGWDQAFFSGTFLGNGRTLTVNLDNRMAEEEGCAPFFRTVGATIENLRVAGTITTDNKFAGGIVSHMKHTTLEGCVSSVTIISSVSGDGTHGGVVGVIESGAGSSYVRGCVFDGVICCTAANLTHSCGGIAGWIEGPTGWYDCLYAPAAIPEGKYALDMTNCSTFARIEGEFYANSYYTEPLRATQNGWHVYPRDNKPDNVEVVNDYGFTKTYNNHCIEYNGKFYAEPQLSGHLNGGVYWTTYYNQNVRFLLPAGATAYTMGNDYQLYRLGTDGRTIPADQAVVIISDKQTIDLISDTGTSEVTDHALGGNILCGSDNEVTVSGISSTVYVLGFDGSKLGLYKYTGAKIPANKAYYVK